MMSASLPPSPVCVAALGRDVISVLGPRTFVLPSSTRSSAPILSLCDPPRLRCVRCAGADSLARVPVGSSRVMFLGPASLLLEWLLITLFGHLDRSSIILIVDGKPSRSSYSVRGTEHPVSVYCSVLLTDHPWDDLPAQSHRGGQTMRLYTPLPPPFRDRINSIPR